MEIRKFRSKGEEFYSIYVGSAYYFTSNYYGLMAVARRKEQEVFDRNKAEFEIEVGNHHCIGGRFTESVVISFVEKVVTNSENMMIPKEVSFVSTYRDLADVSLHIEAI